MDKPRAPHFDGTNYPYWQIRMASHLEAVDLDVWRVTSRGMNPIKRPDNPTVGDKKDASTSCIDLIFESHSPLCKSWYESVTIDELASENEKLKQEVQQLKMDLTTMKKQAQPSQDNRSKVVNKLEEGQTVVCFICHKEGHKSYMCKSKEAKKKWEEAKKRREATSNANSSMEPTLGNDQAMSHNVTKGGKWGKAKAM